MSRLLGRFRLLVPPASYLIVYVLLYLACNLPVLMWGLNPAFPAPPQMSYTRRGMLVFGLLAYGAYRAFAFHPYFRNGYRKWLESTPWNWRRPLPVGPARPVWEDAVIVAAMSAPAWYFGDFGPLATFCIPLGSYLMALSLTFPATGAWGFHILTMFTVGLAVRFWDRPPTYYTTAILLAWAFGTVGLGRSLKHWPWVSAVPEIEVQRLDKLVNAQIENLLGWPYDRLGPRSDKPTTWRSTLDAFFACVIATWWFYAILGIAPEQGRFPMAVMVTMYVLMFTVINRISKYVVGYAPPLSMVGRIGRFRPFLPSYDQVFIAPITAIFAVAAGPWLLRPTGLQVDATASISLGVAMIALFIGGPDRRRWQLTGKHRIVPAISSSSKVKGGFIQVG
jgi:hypothetical protein